MTLVYTSVQKILTTLPALGSVTTITSATLAAFAQDAETLVNAKIAGAYTVPVVGAPLLALLSTDIAIYRLMTRRLFSGQEQNKSEWPDRYKEALELLEQIGDGTLPLVTDSGATVVNDESALPWSNTKSFVPTFMEDGVENSRIDPNKLDYIDGLRD
jgi:phage gp36-like protein